MTGGSPAPDEPTRRLLRSEVRRLATLSGRRRTLPATLNVGALAGARLVMPLPESCDAALAADLVTRALDRLDPPAEQQVWITRTGTPVVEDRDLVWHTGTVAGLARHGVTTPAFYVVTRRGWLEVGSGASRVWGRIRATWHPPYDDDRPLPSEPDLVDGWPVRF